MKKPKALYIAFEKWTGFRTRVKFALKKERPSIASADTLLFNSIADYQTFMTGQKLAIIATIVRHKPSSICHLAQLVERDFANVQRDCVALNSMGFIKLMDAKGVKNPKQPRLAFDYQKIVVRMPKVTYTHDFKEAA